MNYSRKKSTQFLLEAVYIIGFPYNVFPNKGKPITYLWQAQPLTGVSQWPPPNLYCVNCDFRK